MDRCSPGLSFNRYDTDPNTEKCVNFYDVLERVGNTNAILQNALINNTMGGPLTRNLSCGNEAEIRTPYSMQMIGTDGMQYVEMMTGHSQL